MRTFPVFVAALVVMAYCVRGADGFALLAVAGVCWTLAAVVGGSVLLVQRRALSNREWCVVALAFFLTASVVFTRWPIRLGPVIYRDRFRSLADRVAAGHPFDVPVRIGPFRLQRGETEKGFVCLWTNLNSAGRSGYVRASAGQSIPFNTWSDIPAGADWHFIVED